MWVNGELTGPAVLTGRNDQIVLICFPVFENNKVSFDVNNCSVEVKDVYSWFICF